MHSHLIPAIDDGARSAEESREMITRLFELGFKGLITTPHSIGELYPNTYRDLENGFRQLEELNIDSGKLQWSSEYFLDDFLFEQLERDQVKPLPGNRLLIEFSQLSKPLTLEENLFRIAVKGYQVILAHPERYSFFHHNPDDYNRLKDLKIEFQVNALSLIGHYGDRIKKTAEYLIKSKMIDFLGTDIHHLRHLQLLEMVPETKSYMKLIESGELKNNSLEFD